MYIAVDSTKKLNAVYTKSYYKNKLEHETKKSLNNYNEFEL